MTKTNHTRKYYGPKRSKLFPKFFLLFWANFVPKLEGALLKRKIDAKRYSRVLILNSKTVF